MALITLQHTNINSGAKVAILCSGLTVGYSKTNMANPNANYEPDTTTVRVQSKSIANPIYTLQNIKLNSGVVTVKSGVTTYNTLTEEMLKDFFVLENTDTDPIILNVTYGDSTTLKSLHKYASVRTADIPVTFNGSVKLSIDANDSRDAYMPIGSIILLETKKI